MAIASAGWKLNVTMGDNGRRHFIKTFEFRDTITTHAAAVAAAAALIVDLEGVSQLEILGYQVSEVFLEDTVAYPVGLNAQGEMGALLNLSIENEPLKTATQFIPGPKDADFVGASGTAAYDDVDGTAFVDWLANFLETGGTFSISDGEQVADVGGFKSGRRIHRKSRRG